MHRNPSALQKTVEIVPLWPIMVFIFSQNKEKSRTLANNDTYFWPK
jgi:hypothetical protein